MFGAKLTLRSAGCGTSMVASSTNNAVRATPLQKGAVGALQARHATRVGFWRTRRKIRNPYTNSRKPIVLTEDTRSQGLTYELTAYAPELKKWRKRFQDAVRHSVSEFEEAHNFVKHGRDDTVVRKMLHLRKGMSLGDLRRLSMKDNPYALTNTTQMYAKEVLVGGNQSTGRLAKIMAETGKTLDEARKAVLEIKAKSLVHRSKLSLRSRKGGVVGRSQEFGLRGEASEFKDEFSEVWRRGRS